MKKVDFKKAKIGDLVQVPRAQFSQQRRGWNGWLFSEAVVIKKGVTRKDRKPVIKVEMCIQIAGKNNYKTIERSFYADCVFYTTAIERARKILSEGHITCKEDFSHFIQDDDVIGAEWIRFLADKGFILGG